MSNTTEISTCIGDAQFIAIDPLGGVTFDSGKEICAEFEGTIARISSATENEFVNLFLNSLPDVSRTQSFWIGKMARYNNLV